MPANENGPATPPPSGRWSQQLQEVTDRVEQDLRRVVTYINDEVVPDIRRSSSQALRAAAQELARLAQRMDDTRSAAPPSPGTPPPGPPPKDPPRP